MRGLFIILIGSICIAEFLQASRLNAAEPSVNDTTSVTETQPTPTSTPKPIENVSITVLYDNVPFREDLRTDWGFSCLVRGAEKTILFDTGANGPILLENMKKLGISPEEIDIVFHSHIHSDHVGGINAFLEKNPLVAVYVPASVPQRFKAIIKKCGANVTDIKKPRKILVINRSF